MTLEKLGRYEILGELGKGAMGIVYLGRDPLIGRKLALKTFRLGYSAADKELEQFRVRFLREAQSAGILTHPNIVTIHDVSVDPNGDCFIAMEYVQGTDLKILMQRQKQLDPRFVVEVVSQIADGLGYAHSKGVVHRDIKPANIIITSDKQAKITDFGIARVETSNLTMEGQLLGTPNYMSPEQIQGQEVDHRADIFSLGVMLYEMVTGQKPFYGENLSAVTHRIVFGDFTPPEQIVPGLPPGIMQVLGRALAKDPAERYSGGGEMADDLRAVFAPPPAASGSMSATGTSSFLPNPTPQPPAVPQPGPPAAAAPPAPSATHTMGGTVAPPQPASATQHPSPPPIAPADAAAGASAPAEAAVTAPVAPATQAGGNPFLAVPTAGRMATVAGVVLALSLVVAGVARLAVRPEEISQREDPELERQIETLPFLKKGRQLLEQGQPAAALDEFERASAIAPDNREIRRWRDRAEREVLQSDGVELEEAYATERIEAARDSLRRRDYAAVVRYTEQVLAMDPEHRAAKDLLRDARTGQRRLEQLAARQRSEPAPPSAAQAIGADAPAVAETPAAEAKLDIAFFSEVSEGRLTIFTGQEKIYQQSFKFVTGKSGFLRRARKTSGSLKDQLILPSGDLDLRIYVWRKGSQTKSAEVKGNLPPGSTRVLHIELSKDGRVNVRLE